MKRTSSRKALASILIGAGLVLGPALSDAQTAAKAVVAKPERYKLVLQVGDADPAKWNLALNNARNVQDDLGRDNVDVEIVAYGPGLPMLKADSRIADRLALALDNEFALVACEYTMRNTKVQSSEMHKGVRYVDAGVVHIMKRQREDRLT